MIPPFFVMRLRWSLCSDPQVTHVRVGQVTYAAWRLSEQSGDKWGATCGLTDLLRHLALWAQLQSLVRRHWGVDHWYCGHPGLFWVLHGSAIAWGIVIDAVVHDVSSECLRGYQPRKSDQQRRYLFDNGLSWIELSHRWICRSLGAAFFIVCRAEFLSMLIGIVCVAFRYRGSTRSLCNHIVCWTASVAAIYSASKVDNATVFCLHVNQKLGVPAILRTTPE